MKLDVKFAANDKVIKSNFGEIYEVSDGGYDRGYNDGYKVGEKDGFGNGYDVGLEDGYEAGYNKAESVNPLYYIGVKAFQWYQKAFPEGFNFVLKLKDKPADCNAMLSGATGLKTATISCEATGTVSYAQMFRETDIEKIDLTNFKPTPTNLSYFVLGCDKLLTILGVLDLTSCTNTTNAFHKCYALENIEFVPNTIPISISFSSSTKLTHDSLLSILNGLMDYGEKTFDITDNPFEIMTAMEMPMQYMISSVTENEEGYEISAVAAADGNTYFFFCPKSYNYSQEIIDTLKEGTYFNIDCEIVGDTWKVNSWTINVAGSETTQTLTLGTTNLNKLTTEEKAIATEKGWSLV